MDMKWTLFGLIVCFLVCALNGQRTCPMPKAILPCRCLVRGDEYQIWCTHSDLPSVLDGLRAIAKFIQEPIDEVILENNYLPALPGRTFFPLKIMRLMLRHNGLERVSNDWLGGLETTLMELFIVEPKLRTIPEDSLMQLIALQAVTIQTNLMKRLPFFGGLPKLRYLQLESLSLQDLSPMTFKDNPSLEKIHIAFSPHLNRLEANIFRDLPSLSLLNISNCGITWMHHRAITRLPSLQELVLIGNRISDAGMIGRASRDLPQLQILKLDWNSIDRVGEAAFVDLPSLQSLYLSHNKITELHHGAFHRVPSLRQLNLNGNYLRRVHPESFLQQSGSGLEELFLVSNEISHVADLRAILDALPRLVFLDMSYNQLEAIPFGSLRGHPTLEHFNLDHNNIHLIDREAFVAMPALRELRLRNNSLSDSLQMPLWNLPELKGLDLADNYFRKIEPAFLQDLPSLRKLDLSRNELSFIDPAAFIQTPSLERINISHNLLPMLHPATFRSLLGLYELDASNNRLVEFIPGLPRGVEYLHIRYNKIRILPPPPTPDLDLPNLKMLDLTGNKIELLPKQGLDVLPQLRRLYLARNFLKKLDDDNLKGLSRLESLDISQNGLTFIGANVFRSQQELRDVNLGDNQLDLLMPELFQFSPRLKRLNLTRNVLTEILPGTLDKNKDLQMVDLSHNKLLRLSTIMGLKNLRVLDVTNNRLNSIDPDLLGSLPSLRILKLCHNYIKVLKENAFYKLQHLASLDLEDNEVEVVEANAVKALPLLKKLKFNRNKIREIPDMAFTNLPSLQVVELQENNIQSISAKSFSGLPHMLMLNLSHNQLPSFDEAGLAGLRSLELLDISHNQLKSVSSSSLEKLEWLVELRIDDNKICGVQGSPFNNMPRLRALSMRNNNMMSFPERAVERIRNNIALLDIEGNPLACSCNMLWLQVWLQENALIGPRCSDGYLLRELELLRRDCPEEERNVELVAPGCEAELLSAPGVYGVLPVSSQWMNLKAVNDTQDRNMLAPSPEESEYFYDEFVDYPFNDTRGRPDVTTNLPQPIGDTIYASPKTKTNPEKEIPKEVSHSPSSSGFTFFGVPLSNIGNLLSNAVNGRKQDKMDDRMAIVNRAIDTTRTPPNEPEIEIGGFKPILPGSGGFKPMTHLPIKTKDTVTEESRPVNTEMTTTTTTAKSTTPLIEISRKSSQFPDQETTTTEPPQTTFTTEITTTPKPESTTVAKMALLVPKEPPMGKSKATITKVQAPSVPSASASLRSEMFDALPPMAHNRDAKMAEPSDMGWYFATYNGTVGSRAGKLDFDRFCLVLVGLFVGLRMC